MRAVIVTQAVMSVPALVMKIFEPFITQLAVAQLGPRPGRARVGAGARLGQAERGEPRPEARSGSHVRFCSSEPKSRIGIVPSDVCAATVIAMEESIRASSSIAMA